MEKLLLSEQSSLGWVTDKAEEKTLCKSSLWMGLLKTADTLQEDGLL
jgi:hypothetical protein